MLRVTATIVSVFLASSMVSASSGDAFAKPDHILKITASLSAEQIEVVAWFNEALKVLEVEGVTPTPEQAVPFFNCFKAFVPGEDYPRCRLCASHLMTLVAAKNNKVLGSNEYSIQQLFVLAFLCKRTLGGLNSKKLHQAGFFDAGKIWKIRDLSVIVAQYVKSYLTSRDEEAVLPDTLLGLLPEVVGGLSAWHSNCLVSSVFQSCNCSGVSLADTCKITPKQGRSSCSVM